MVSTTAGPNDLGTAQSIESGLGISLPVWISEYGVLGETNGNPGNEVLWFSWLENSGTHGSYAMWTPPGQLDGMVALGTNNEPTGAWWPYEWYGSMSGNTYALNWFGMGGMASADPNNDQIRVVSGGASGTQTIILQNINSLGFPATSSTVHATVWGVDRTAASSLGTGWVASPGPYWVQEANYSVSGGTVTITIPNAKVDTAYYTIVTPNTWKSNVNTAGVYEAEYANLTGGATAPYANGVTGYKGTAFVAGYGLNAGATTDFVVQEPNNGYYNVTLRYSSELAGKSLQINLNGSPLTTVSLAQTRNISTWKTVSTSMFLLKGINRIDYVSLANGASSNVEIDDISIAPGSGTITTYQASGPGTSLGGGASVITDSSAPGGNYVGWIGQGGGNYLEFDTINVPTSGTYRMIVWYTNSEWYVNNTGEPVFRYTYYGIDGNPMVKIYFDNTYSWSNWVGQEFDIQLNAGNNILRIWNPDSTASPYNNESGWAPNIAQIQIAAPQ